MLGDEDGNAVGAAVGADEGASVGGGTEGGDEGGIGGGGGGAEGGGRGGKKTAAAIWGKNTAAPNRSEARATMPRMQSSNAPRRGHPRTRRAKHGLRAELSQTISREQILEYRVSRCREVDDLACIYTFPETLSTCDMGRSGEIWEMRLSCEPLLATCDMGRYGEIWGDEVEL